MVMFLDLSDFGGGGAGLGDSLLGGGDALGHFFWFRSLRTVDMQCQCQAVDQSFDCKCGKQRDSKYLMHIAVCCIARPARKVQGKTVLTNTCMRQGAGGLPSFTSWGAVEFGRFWTSLIRLLSHTQPCQAGVVSAQSAAVALCMGLTCSHQAAGHETYPVEKFQCLLVAPAYPDVGSCATRCSMLSRLA